MFSRCKHVASSLLLLPVLAAQIACAATMDDELLIDPTAPLIPLTNAEGAAGDDGGLSLGLLDMFTRYELSSVLIRAEDRIAVINGKRVRVGDSVGSATVTSIEADRVTLNVDGEIETLELYENSIKTLVKGDE